MPLILALIDGGSIFIVAGGILLIWTRPILAGLVDVLRVLAEAAGLSLCFLVAFYCANLYNLRVIRSFEALLGRLPGALAAAVLLTALVSMLVSRARITSEVLELSVLVPVGVVFGPILPLRVVACRLLRNRRLGGRLLIAGESPLARTVIEEIERQPDLPYTVISTVSDAKNLDRIVQATRPHRIVVALTERRGRLPLYSLAESLARGIVVEDVTETYERLTGKLALEALSPSSIIFSPHFRATRFNGALARIVSFLISMIGLILLAPILSLIALLIKLDSPGPVFFIQERVGLSGRTFKIIKFRTMHPVSRSASEWERDNRDRITRLGRWLRRFRLDELPQLVNVVRGDMNLVGPRPHPVTNLEMMILTTRNLSEACGYAIPYYSLRCSVRPGITGWSQVRFGYANSLEEEMEKIRYDLYYIKHHSLWLDLRILFETLKIVLRGRNGIAPASRPARLIEADGRATVLGEPQAWVPADEPAEASAGVQ